MYVEITEDTFIGGEHAKAGKKYEVDEDTLKTLVRCKKGKPCEAPAGAGKEKAKAKEVA